MSEKSIHSAVVKYLKLQYPNIYFHTDLSGQYVKPSQLKTIQAQKGQPGFPDLIIFKSMNTDIGGIFNRPQWFSGLVLEIKKETPYLKDGVTLKSSEHLKNQIKWLSLFRTLGFYADFSVGVDNSIQLIDDFLSGLKPS